MKRILSPKVVCETKFITPKMQYTHKDSKQQKCFNCKNYKKDTKKCSVFSIVNHVEKTIVDVDASHCRESKELCSPFAFYFDDESKPAPVEIVPAPENYIIQYFIDGSSTFSNATTVSVDEYYDNIHIEFNDVY